MKKYNSKYVKKYNYFIIDNVVIIIVIVNCNCYFHKMDYIVFCKIIYFEQETIEKVELNKFYLWIYISLMISQPRDIHLY